MTTKHQCCVAPCAAETVPEITPDLAGAVSTNRAEKHTMTTKTRLEAMEEALQTIRNKLHAHNRPDNMSPAYNRLRMGCRDIAEAALALPRDDWRPIDISTQLEGIARKLRTYASIYIHDKEALRMADWCEGRAQQFAALAKEPTR